MTGGRWGSLLDVATERTALQWERAATRAAKMPPETLSHMEARADRLAAALEAFGRAVDLTEGDRRKTRPPVPLPPHTDWHGRPSLWTAPLEVPGRIAEAGETKLTRATSLWHDCPWGEVILRQVPNPADDRLPPHALRIEVFRFDGSYLSVAVRLPEAALEGLGKRHVVRLDLPMRSDRPIGLYARLNVKVGPNVGQMLRERPRDGGIGIEFDLAYAEIEEGRVEEAWIDLMLEDPAQVGVELADVWIARHLRADL